MTPISLTLQLGNNPDEAPGYATVPVAIQDWDGTVPTFQNANTAVVSTSVGTYNASTGILDVVFTAVALTAGVNISMFIEGVDNQDFIVTVEQAPLETGTVDPSKIVITPPM